MYGSGLELRGYEVVEGRIVRTRPMVGRCGSMLAEVADALRGAILLQKVEAGSETNFSPSEARLLEEVLSGKISPESASGAERILRKVYGTNGEPHFALELLPYLVSPQQI